MEIVNFTKYGKIAIIGYPNSRMKKMAEDIKFTEGFEAHVVIHADDFLEHGEFATFKLMDALLDCHGRYVVEGTLCFRLLRKIEETGNYWKIRPDVIIECKPIREEDRHKPFVKGLQTIWEDYVRIRKIELPMYSVKW